MAEISNHKHKIPYGISDFRRIRNEGFYYVDKTEYLAKMEAQDSFVFFVRPRRFGKSLFLSMMESYYDLNQKKDFDKLFGGLWLGGHPTENIGRYMVLKLDFSKVGGKTNDELEKAFETHIGWRVDDMVQRYAGVLGPAFAADYAKRDVAAGKIDAVIAKSRRIGVPLYLIIDEYDNFTNQMIRETGVGDYRSITHGAGFYRNWFKKFKGDFDRIFMTGVSPVTMDDLTSGFNIATNISQESDFNSMLGFSEAECVRIYTDFKGVGRYTQGDPAEWVQSFKPWYDGYCFSEEQIDKESVFNSDMVLYHLSALVKTGRAPKDMVDRNIKTDYDKLETIADIQHRQFRKRHGDAAVNENQEDVLPLTEELAATGRISFDLVESFPAEEIADEANFRSLFHYYGILSMAGREEGQTVFKIPNACVEKQLFGYLRGAYKRTRIPSWLALGKLAGAMAYRGEWKPYFERLAADLKDTQPVRGGIDREIRVQGYMQCEFGHLNFYLARPEMELSRGYCDFALFPERTYFGDVKHSYLVELKSSKADATEAELAAKYAEAVDQLAKYRADPFVPALARGTTLHQIVYQFKGDDPVRIEQIAEEAM